MFFLKNKSSGIKKKNIIFIENFLDPVTKKKIIYKGFKSKIFKVHDQSNKLTKDIKNCYRIYFKILNKLKIDIERSTSSKINPKILNLIFSKWLFFYISSSYYKYKLLLKIKKKYPKFGLIDFKDKNITEEDKDLLMPDSTILSYKLMKDIGKILGAGILKINFSKVIDIIRFIPSRKNIMGNNKYILSNYIKYLTSKISICISKTIHRKTIYLHDDTLNFFDTLKIIIRSGFKFSYLFFLEGNLRTNKNEKKTIHFKKIKSKDNFENILIENFINYMPRKIFHLLNFYKLNIKNKNIKKNKNLIISKRFYASGYTKFSKFLIRNITKSILISYQHGGLYGQEKYFIPEKSERMISDHFISWGWKEKKAFPLPMKISKLHPKKNNNNKYCLFVTWSQNYGYFSYGNNPELTPKLSMNPTLGLLKYISKKIPTILRPQPIPGRDDHVWRDKEFYGKIKKIKIDNHEKNFEFMAANAKFVIMNYFNTTALETLSMNIPTLVFCDKNLINFNSKASKFLLKLIKAKIFFYNHKELYNFLKMNNFDLNTWWNDKKTQDIRKIFCKNYCLRKENWDDEWISKLSLM